MNKVAAAGQELQEAIRMGEDMIKQENPNPMKVLAHLDVLVDSTTAERQIKELTALFEQEKSFFECPVEEIIDLFRFRVSDLISHIVARYDPVASKASGMTSPCFKVEFDDGFDRLVAAIRAHDPECFKF